MKHKKIRKGMFETNSSSMHSIVINPKHKDPIYDTLVPDEDGILAIDFEEFGWGLENYKDSETKLSYAATYAFNYGTKEDREMLEEVLFNVTGAKKLVFNVDEEDEYDPKGYIDHQSIDVAKDVFVSKYALGEFIFSSDVQLIIDNDNH